MINIKSKLIYIFTVALYFVAGRLVKIMPAQSGPIMALYAVFTLWQIGRYGDRDYFYLNPVKMDFSKILPFVPMFSVALMNIAIGGFNFNLNAVLFMSGVVVYEELFYRSFLLRLSREMGIKNNVILVSAIFGLAHFFNMGSPSADYVVLQALGAMLVAVSYCIATLYFDSVYPAMAAHFLTNVTGAGIYGQATDQRFLIANIIWIAFYALYVKWLKYFIIDKGE